MSHVQYHLYDIQHWATNMHHLMQLIWRQQYYSQHNQAIK
jgi:hypothetical protein